MCLTYAPSASGANHDGASCAENFRGRLIIIIILVVVGSSGSRPDARPATLACRDRAELGMRGPAGDCTDHDLVVGPSKRRIPASARHIARTRDEHSSLQPQSAPITVQNGARGDECRPEREWLRMSTEWDQINGKSQLNHGPLLARAMSTRPFSSKEPQERRNTVHVAMNAVRNKNGHHLSPRPWNWTKQRRVPAVLMAGSARALHTRPCDSARPTTTA